jgi:hypothetical protein
LFRLTKLGESQGGWESIVARSWEERSARAAFDAKDKTALLEAFRREVERETAASVERQMAGQSPDCVGGMFEGSKPRASVLAFWNYEEMGALEWLLGRACFGGTQQLSATADAERLLTAEEGSALRDLAKRSAGTSQPAMEAELSPDFPEARPDQRFEVADALVGHVGPAVFRFLTKAQATGDPVWLASCVHL